MKKLRIEYEWAETGKLEIDVEENHSAVLRFTPSNLVVEKTLAKFVKKAGNENYSKSNKTIHKQRNKPP